MHAPKAPETLMTARLRLRKPSLDDAEAIFRTYATDEDVTRFMVWRPHRSSEETRAYLARCLNEWSSGKGFPYVIEVAESPNELLGMIHLHRRPYAMEFGYLIARPHWGKGYASEALTRVVDWSLDRPEIWRASALCDVDNTASARVMEKAGMTFEGILRRYLVHPNISPEPRDCRVYSKIR